MRKRIKLGRETMNKDERWEKEGILVKGTINKDERDGKEKEF